MPNTLDDIELRSEDVQEILTKAPHWMIRRGNVLFLSLIILVMILSWFIKYPDSITAQAIITTKTPPQKEYAKTTGKISAIFVKDNEGVTQNQSLAILENTANHEEVYTLKSILDTITFNNKSFNFSIDSLPVFFLGDIDPQYALFENSYIRYKLNKELKPYSNEAMANSYAISELNNRLKSLQAQKDINKSELEFKRKDLERNKNLYEKGIISTQDYENKQLELAQGERNFKNFEASISQLREGISNAHRKSIGTEINRTKEEMTLLKNVIQSYNQLKKAIKDWEYQYVLKSNIDGNVTFLNYWNTNQTVNQGDLVFTIIPSPNPSFIAKLKTPVQNSGKLKVGQKVNIKLENYPDTEFGILNGIVNNISLIPDKDGFYIIDVELPKRLITSYNKEIEFKQEMIGTAQIITEDLRVIERIFYQFIGVFKR